MSIGPDQVRHIALLARLSLTADEEVSLARDLGNILDHFRRLDDLDTEGIEPTAHVTSVETPFRDDVVENAPAPERWLANAPVRDDRFFQVPKIIE